VWIDDEILVRCDEPLALGCFVPSSHFVVLGSSNAADVEVDTVRCGADAVPVLKRYGGGGTVLLHGGCVVVSLGTWVRQYYQNSLYFAALNQAVIDALALRWPVLAALGQAGHSDIVYVGRKVAGTSLFRSRNYLLYQASLLVDVRRELIDRYLRHPSREPDYRQGRPHGDFLVGLSELASELTPESCLAQLRRALPETLEKQLAGELVPPDPTQFAGLHRRAQASSSPHGS